MSVIPTLDQLDNVMVVWEDGLVTTVTHAWLAGLEITVTCVSLDSTQPVIVLNVSRMAIGEGSGPSGML